MLPAAPDVVVQIAHLAGRRRPAISSADQALAVFVEAIAKAIRATQAAVVRCDAAALKTSAGGRRPASRPYPASWASSGFSSDPMRATRGNFAAQAAGRRFARCRSPRPSSRPSPATCRPTCAESPTVSATATRLCGTRREHSHSPLVLRQRSVRETGIPSILFRMLTRALLSLCLAAGAVPAAAATVSALATRAIEVVLYGLRRRTGSRQVTT